MVVQKEVAPGMWSLGSAVEDLVPSKFNTYFFLLLAAKPDVQVKEKQDGTHLTLDCIVMYQGKRVTTGVIWTDGKGHVLSENDHLEINLKGGMNMMRCKYEVGGYAGYKTLVRILQISGSAGGSGEKCTQNMIDSCLVLLIYLRASWVIIKILSSTKSE